MAQLRRHCKLSHARQELATSGPIPVSMWGDARKEANTEESQSTGETFCYNVFFEAHCKPGEPRQMIKHWPRKREQLPPTSLVAAASPFFANKASSRCACSSKRCHKKQAAQRDRSFLDRASSTFATCNPRCSQCCYP